MVAATANQLKGDNHQSRRRVARTEDRRPGASVERFRQAVPYKYQENRDRMDRALRRAGF